MRFLIVDDRPDIGLLMTRLVNQAGHDASLARDGFAAVRLATALQPAVVLLDINMPGIDGYETAPEVTSKTRESISDLRGHGQPNRRPASEPKRP